MSNASKKRPNTINNHLNHKVIVVSGDDMAASPALIINTVIAKMQLLIEICFSVPIKILSIA